MAFYSIVKRKRVPRGPARLLGRQALSLPLVNPLESKEEEKLVRGKPFKKKS